MNRRKFVATGLGGALGAMAFSSGEMRSATAHDDDIRAVFPRMKEETYINAAGMMPLSTFSIEGLQRYLAFHPGFRK